MVKIIALCLSFMMLPVMLVGTTEPKTEPQLGQPQLGEVKAYKVEYDGNNVFLSKDVSIMHDFGSIYCDEAKILLEEDLDDNKNKGIVAEKIFLHGNVCIDTKDGSHITSDDAEIDCKTGQARFTAIEPNCVTSRARLNDGAAPVKTTAKAMRITLKKVNDQYILSDVQGEGAVQIEYQIEDKDGN
ncbi:MAG TPA: hypothetical protein VN457_02060 [Chlamydiales bacterium]|nr:hypothetical protein [Chlamydiales bacterium]